MNNIFNINVCRVCLQNDQKCDLSDRVLLEKFEFTTRLQISREDNLPKAICSKCTKRLNIAHNFITTAHESEKSLKRFIDKISSEFREVAEGKKSHNKRLYEKNDTEDDLFSSLLDEENPPEMLSGETVIDIDNRKEEIDCCFPKETLLLHASNEIVSSCASNQHSIEICAEGNTSKENYDEDAEQGNEINNIQRYTDVNILESNTMEHDGRSQSAVYAIEEENHDYDMIINTQDDSTQCESINNDESSTEESNKKFEDINIINLKEDSENPAEEDDGEKDALKKIETSSNKGILESRFYCDKCSRDFSTKTNLNRHMHSHEGKKPFSCTKCIKSFTQKSTLKQHMYTHTGERPYVCQVCNRGFTQHKSLMFHMRRHTGEKPFHCEYCLITFRQKDALRIHILKHHVVIERDMDGVESFSCIICQKRFERKVEFKMHMKVHTANVPEPSRTKKFQCRKCFKCFALKKSLIRHMCIHTDRNDDYVRECFECDVQFSCTEEYQEHLSIYHQYACPSCPNFFVNSVQELKIHMFEHQLNEQRLQ